MANIFETARAERSYNKLVKGIESVAGLVETLSGPGPFTIFVPIDAAFDRLSYDQQANPVRESIKINGGQVIRANVNADNGIIHVIDKVLIPAFTML